MSSLREDPDRYFLAFLQAHIEMGALIGKSDNVIAEYFFGCRYGHLVETQENVDAFERGEKFKVFAIPNSGGIKLAGNLGGEKWRDKNIFRVRAFDALGKLRRIRKAPPSHPNRRWLAAMVKSWIRCLQGFEEDIDLVRQMAVLAGEGKYFVDFMIPIMRERSAQRLAGLERALPPQSKTTKDASR